MVLVDSDILIEVSRGKDSAVVAQWIELSESAAPILVSPVSVAELWADAPASESGTLTALVETLSCIPINALIGRLAGDYLRRYRKSHSVELADALIAATAAETGARLWTRDRKHYPMKDITFFA